MEAVWWCTRHSTEKEPLDNEKPHRRYPPYVEAAGQAPRSLLSPYTVQTLIQEKVYDSQRLSSIPENIIGIWVYDMSHRCRDSPCGPTSIRRSFLVLVTFFFFLFRITLCFTGHGRLVEALTLARCFGSIFYCEWAVGLRLYPRDDFGYFKIL